MGVHLLRFTVLVVAAALGLCACQDASGCGDFNPGSPVIGVGESQDVTVEIVDGGWSDPDVSGGYWTTDEPVPASVGSGTELDGVATLVSEDKVVIDFGKHGSVRVSGPIGCA
jgi:hypothetical protein